MTDDTDPVPAAAPSAAGVGAAYPPAPGWAPGPHHRGLQGKLSNMAVVAIAVGVAVLAGGIVALVVLLGNHTAPRPGPTRPAAAATESAGSSSSHVVLLAKRRGRAPHSSRGRSTVYDFGHGVKLTTVPGWTQIDNVPNGADLLSPDQGAEMFFELFPAPNATDPSSEIGTFNVPWLSNIQVDGSTLQTFSITDSQFFTTEASEQYTANQSSNQGTQQVYGFFVVALDPNNFEVFGVYEAASVSEYNKNAKAAINMLITATG
jgi:hypothetical protein